jgi:hypothetical protein
MLLWRRAGSRWWPGFSLLFEARWIGWAGQTARRARTQARNAGMFDFRQSFW